MEAHARAEESWPPLSLGHTESAPRLVSTAATLQLETTAALEIIDLTDRVEAFLCAVHLETGWVNVQSRHTTTGLLVNEHEPLLLEDLIRLLERLAPRDVGYAHDALHRRADVRPDERPNGHSHAKASLLGTSETLNVAGARLRLGRWQRILFVELDGPRDREISLAALGHGRRR
ncbi:MAG: secondary thiamine-phosphate synthase enzyme YjbQ [Acidobacteriota bacterium]|jgi:secondary thiamine-phosphate synthase enzyme